MNSSTILPSLAGSKLDFQWSKDNQLMVYASKSLNDYGPKQAESVQFDKIPEHKRALIYATHPIFLEVQATAKESPQKTQIKSKKNFLLLSQQYRKQIENQANRLQKQDSKSKELVLFHHIYMIWHLMEVLNLSKDKFVSVSLLQWIELGFPDNEDLQQLTREIFQNVLPCNHPKFWFLLKKFLIRGHYQQASKLLQQSNQVQKTFELETLEKCLERAPSLQTMHRHSKAEFESKWSQWQMDCQLAFDLVKDNTKSPLYEILSILTGKEEAIVNTCKNWKEALVCLLLHQNPTLEPFQLGDFIHSNTLLMAKISQDSLYDRLYCSLLENDLVQTVLWSSKMDTWFSAHFIDFLIHISSFDYSEEELNLREFLLTNYGIQLMQDEGFWPLGADYLMQFPINGKSILKEMIIRIPISSDQILKRLILCCEQYQLSQEKQMIYKVEAHQKLAKKQYAPAIVYYLEAQYYEPISQIVSQFIQNYLKTGQSDFIKILFSLGPNLIQQHEQLIFLDYYSQFLKLVKDQKPKEAGKILIGLLTANDSPKKYWPMLLMDSVSLLQEYEIVFDEDDTLELLRCFESLNLSYKCKEYFELLKENSDIDLEIRLENGGRSFAKKLQEKRQNETESVGLGRIEKVLNVLEKNLKPKPKGVEKELLAVPVSQRPIFPFFYKAVTVKDQQLKEAILQNLKNNNPYLALFLSKEEDLEKISSPEDVHPVGVMSHIYSVLPEDQDQLTMLVYSQDRVKMTKFISPKNLSAFVDQDSVEEPAEMKSLAKVLVETVPDEPFDPESEEIASLSAEIIKNLNRLAEFNPLVSDQIQEYVKSLNPINKKEGEEKKQETLRNQISKLANFSAAMSDVTSDELQEILECTNMPEKLKKSLNVLKKELINAQLQDTISQDMERKIGERDREVFLKERLKKIQKELGMETNSRDKLIEKYKKRVENLTMPEPVKKVFNEELSKLQILKPSAQEYNLTTNYLDWLSQIPWGKRLEENFDLKNAKQILDEDHFGLSDVKERILEFIAVGKLRGTVEGKIICLNGPPGVGKTSIGKSIARALNRKFFRFSVGGLYDVAEIKGHRRNYVGALPGKLVQALKRVQTENPLILIDEIDKVGHGGQNGDPASVLLEVLDPEQNNSFLDYYLDVPVDLSKVLFVCTSNTIDTIPAPLLDRMEVIQLSGYVLEEKLSIAEKYLMPQASLLTGISNEQIQMDKKTLEKLIKQYCRENGVRNLKKQIEKIYRKAAYKLVENPNQTIKVTEENLHDFVGSPVFTSDRLYQQPPKGVVMGLAYNQMGGSSLYIESILDAPLSEQSKPHFIQTGNLGDVMKESSNIAYSYAKHFFKVNFPNLNFFQHGSIHLHVPEGAIPKDGPSAGIAMCSSLISLALDAPIPSDIAMTGEISLTGKVLKIGGVKEKVIAASRSGIKRIILPSTNKPDFDELAEYIKKDLQPIFVDHYEQVAKILFPNQTNK